MVREPTKHGGVAKALHRPLRSSSPICPPAAGRPLPAARSVPRRGAILLIVLGMLSLFMLITISFVLEAGHERRGTGPRPKRSNKATRPTPC